MKRVAVVMHGGVGTGHFSQGYPALEKLLIGLSSPFEIVVYSRFPANENYQSTNFTFRSAPASVKSGALRWLYVMTYFLRDHGKNKFHLLVAFWGYPAGFLATGLAKIARIPSAVYLLGSDSFGIASINFGILHRPLLQRIALWTYKHASLLLGISEFQKKSLARYGVTNLTVIPWGIDRASYQFVNKERSSVLHIIHIAHLTPVKDQVTLLKAFARLVQLRPAELRIYGVDRMNGAIQRLAQELGVQQHVQFLEVVPYRQMPELYSWADLMMHTSIVEGQSMALTEAAACGVLLAGTRVGVLHDMGDNCGLIVEVGDFEGLAAKIAHITGDQNSWRDKVQNARRWAEAHDLSWTINGLESCLTNLVGGRRAK